MKDSTIRLRRVARIIGKITNASLAPQPQLSSSAASMNSFGKECSAASSTNMLKRTHIQLVTKMSDGSVVLGSLSQALVHPARQRWRTARVNGADTWFE